MKSIVIVPECDRKLASDLDKLDRFTSSLAASFDLLNSAIDSGSFIEAIAISANQIDAYLRLSLVITKQMRDKVDDVDVRYLFQADGDRGIMERKIFDESLKLGIIDKELSAELNSLYDLRNLVIHKYIISNFRTRELGGICDKYLIAAEKVRIILSDLEDSQAKLGFGIYGKKYKYGNSRVTSDAVREIYASVYDKHLLKKYKRNVDK